MNKAIEIVDRGRGWQLSTSRITVQDLVPYFQDGWSYAQIQQCMPTLSSEEIAAVEQYYRAHQSELDDQDRRIRERIAQRRNPTAVEDVARRGGAKMAALRADFQRRKQLPPGRNGDNAAR